MTAAASRTLRDKAEADRGEVMIEREGNPDSDAFHDREARRIDRGKLVQVRAAKIIPRLFQVAQLAREDPHGSRLADGILPRQRYIAVCIAIEEREGFDDDGNGGMKPSAGSLQNVPLLSRGGMERIADKRKR